MSVKPKYEELEQRVKELEKQVFECSRAEEAFMQTKLEWERTVNAVPDLIAIIDDRYRIVRVNKAMADRLGITPDEAVGLTCYEQVHGTKEPPSFCPHAKLLADGQRQLAEVHEVRLGGYFLVSASPLHDAEGRLIGSVHIAHDITERKQAEESLRKSEQKYRLLADNVTDSIWVLDVDTLKFSFCSPSVERISGFTDQEIMNRSLGDVLSSESMEVAMTALKDELSLEGSDGVAPGRSRVLELEMNHKNGSTVWTEVTATFLRDENGKATGLIGVTRDITERRQAEEEKAKLQNQLHLAQKMEAVGMVAGGVVHDLNNVLSGIVSYPDLLLMDIPEDSPLRKPILTIKNSGKKAAAIVQDLLTLIRRGVNTSEVVNFNATISEYLKSPEYEKLRAFHPGVEVETDLEPDLLNVLGSPVHLYKIIMNLVSNAAEAMPDGGKLSISTENLYLDRPISGYDDVEEGDYVVLTVSDTGTGMSSEDMARIFEPFYTKKAMGKSGTGLGMAVVWGTVKDHKGYIDMQSAEGKGSAFIIYFPATRKRLAKEKSLLLKDYMGNGESILVIDDVEEQREVASEMLGKLGYSVATVSSGEEAVDYMKDNSVDLLVLDMIMDPGIDGLETYKRILDLRPGQKAIIASGFSETEDVKEAQRLGAGAYLKKPYMMEKIGVAVKAELKK